MGSIHFMDISICCFHSLLSSFLIGLCFWANFPTNLFPVFIFDKFLDIKYGVLINTIPNNTHCAHWQKPRSNILTKRSVFPDVVSARPQER
jgi:hypothetical protein